MKNKRIALIIIFLMLTSTLIVNAIPDIESYEHKFVKEITSESEKNIKTTSTKDEEVAVIIKEKDFELDQINVSKDGDGTEDNSNYLGTNSALLIYKNAKATINKATISTFGTYSPALYIGKTGTLNLKNAEIEINGKNSTGIIVQGGIASIENTKITTTEESSLVAKISKESELQITNGEFETENINSPIIHTLGKVSIKDSNFVSYKSEGIIIENGANVDISNSTISTSDKSSADSARDYKNLYIQQSEDNNASTTLSITSSEIITEGGTPILITNPNSTINLTENNFSSNSPTLIRVEKSSKNKNTKDEVKLNLDKQIAEGNIMVDTSIKIKISMKNKSKLKGALLGSNKNIDLSIDKDSFIILTADSYLSSLSNEVKDNANIYLNNYTLYVNGEVAEGNKGTPPELYEDDIPVEEKEETTTEKEINANIRITIAVIAIATVLIILVVIILIITLKRNHKNEVMYK